MRAPSFSLPGLADEPLTLDDLLAPGKPVLLAFVDPHCGPCTALVPDLARWQDQYRETLTVALVSRGTADENNRSKIGGYAGLPVLLQADREVAEAYQAYGTPGAVVIRPDGTVGSAVAMGAEAIGRLVAHAVPMRTGGEGVARPAAAALGSPAPALRLPGLDGRGVALEEFRGQRTLVLFWNPGCGHCARMLPDLKRWEASPPEDAPELLLISSGTVEMNRAMGLRSTVVLDQGFATGHVFDVGGTPSAVLVDAKGRIASEVAVGVAQVLALLDAAPPSAVAA